MNGLVNPSLATSNEGTKQTDRLEENICRWQVQNKRVGFYKPALAFALTKSAMSLTRNRKLDPKE